MFYLSRKDYDQLMDQDPIFFKYLINLPHKWALSGPYWN